MEKFVTSYLWLIALVVIWIEAFFLKARANQKLAANPVLEAEYPKVFWWKLFFTSMPWVIMAAGFLLGGITDASQFFSAHNTNPFVLAFYLVLLLELAAGMIWITFMGGAEYVAQFPGIFRRDIQSPGLLKFYAAVSFLTGMLVVGMAWFTGFAKH